MNNVNLQKAIDALHISDLYVRRLVAECKEGYDPKFIDFDDFAVLSKHQVSHSEVVEVDQSSRLFRVFIELGIRWTNNMHESSSEEVAAWIEADYVAEYTITGEVEIDCLEQFALRNVSYHVWPYWRELLTTQCEKMRLPRVMLPTVQFSKNKPTAKLP
jgi:preprotein translocase subunit SecB